VVRTKQRAIAVPTQATFTRVTVTEGQDKDNGKEVFINPLTPNEPYRSRTASLTCKVAFYIFIQQI
jgi:hypothetical protein